MKDFAAIDFETANEQRTSVCSVGVVVVRGGEINRPLLQPHTARAGVLQLLEYPGARLNLGGYCRCAGIPLCVGEGGSTDRRAAAGGPQTVRSMRAA